MKPGFEEVFSEEGETSSLAKVVHKARRDGMLVGAILGASVLGGLVAGLYGLGMRLVSP